MPMLQTPIVLTARVNHAMANHMLFRLMLFRPVCPERKSEDLVVMLEAFERGFDATLGFSFCCVGIVGRRVIEEAGSS